jgi:hypothetical protein
VSCGACPAGESCGGSSCAPCELPDCTTIPCGFSVAVCGATIQSCAPGC